ncbi:MAG: isoprenylcysteine carboxylmethyltransferase family protein [Methanobrevibacter sp.]|nr:isoprenylcysteine carboxylmethyltransferase family protein [Methanobrevibacter sp.]
MNENHLPIFGIGPYLVLVMGGITIISSIFSYYHLIPVYKITELNMVFLILGILLIILGIIFWVLAVVISKIDREVENNNLVTTGIYAYVRHPIYAAFFYIAVGLILISQNILLFVLPIIYWAFLTVAMIKTEEKWLIEKYGDDYIIYSKKVNRFIPKVI